MILLTRLLSALAMFSFTASIAIRILSSRVLTRPKGATSIMSYQRLYSGRIDDIVPSNNMSATAAILGSVTIPTGLRDHLVKSAKKALSKWKITPDCDTDIASQYLVDRIVEYTTLKFSSHLDSTALRAEIVNTSQEVFDAMVASEGNVADVFSSSNFVEDIFMLVRDKIEKNREIFDTITSLHTKIKVFPSVDYQDLASYSRAAASMGKKEWVQDLNKWIGNMAVSYFKLGGARRAYMRHLKLSDPADYEELIKVLDKNIRKDEKIRVLDIGSCYNPLSRGQYSQDLDVVAVDLYPADPSVAKADFFELKIGKAGSDPVYSEDGSTLLQLPEASFDVVAMSLVLSYLPAPEKREAMLLKAKRLMKSAQSSQSPHDTGLLLIAEKASIFNTVDNDKKSGDGGTGDVPRHHIPLLSVWRNKICSFGFDLMKYRCLVSAQRSHVFAFRVSSSNINTHQNSNDMAAYNNDDKLWIQQDFDVVDGEDEQRSRDLDLNLTGASNTDSTATSEVIPVAIVGGGIGGAALALALELRGIPYKLFEKDINMHVRKQGYALTMQQGSTALEALGIGKESLLRFGVPSSSHISISNHNVILGQYGDVTRKSGRPNAEPKIVFAKQDCMSVSRPGSIKEKGRQNIHIPRQKLRELLFERVSPSCISWGKRLVSCSECDDFVSLHFDDGSECRAAVVAAADGIHSTLRKLSSPKSKLHFLGLVVILGISEGVLLDEQSQARIQVQWVDGSSRAFCMPFDKNHTMWQMSFPILEESEALKIGSFSPAELKNKALELCGDWPSPLSDLLHATTSEYVSGHPVYDRDAFEDCNYDLQVSQDRKRSRIAFIGDSAHPMSPFKGQGANQAILDSLSLARALYASTLRKPLGRSIEATLDYYHQEMRMRSSSKVVKSRDAAVYLHSSDALGFGNVTRASAAALLSASASSSISSLPLPALLPSEE